MRIKNFVGSDISGRGNKRPNRKWFKHKEI